MDMVTPAAMAYVIGNLRSEIKVPYGVDAISDGRACLELAAAVKAQFVHEHFVVCMWVMVDFIIMISSFTKKKKPQFPLEDLKMLYFINLGESIGI